MRDTSPLARRSGLVAVAASVAFQLLMIAAILLRPEIDPARKPISEYAIGRLGWLTVLGFQASAASGMIKPWTERRCAGSSRRRRSAASRRFAATDARMSCPSAS